MSIKLKRNGLTESVATGYSWKSLLWGCLYPIYHGDFSGAVIQFVFSWITFGVSGWFFVPFMYNKKRLRRLIQQGFEPSDEKAKSYLRNKLNYQD